MNVFVLCTGRCGSTTFVKACTHIRNFSTAHESRCKFLNDERFAYPQNHIEVDNRLSWFLGRLDEAYGDSSFYVHLRRDTQKVAKSFKKRYSVGIIKAYRGDGIVMGLPEETDPMAVSLDYCKTVNDNITLFLKDKSKKMEFHLESYENDFPLFWEAIEAKGNLQEAMLEFSIKYNASA